MRQNCGARVKTAFGEQDVGRDYYAFWAGMLSDPVVGRVEPVADDNSLYQRTNRHAKR